MLSLNLAKIRTADEHVERVYQPEALGGENDAYRIVAPVSLTFDIHKDKDKFHLVGRVTTTLEVPCSRCLETFTIPVDAPFDLRYQPNTDQPVAGEREIADDDIDTAYYENDEIDLGQLMQEQFYLALPMKPLCTDDCKGLCPHCGTNLNKAACDCHTHWEDPRLAALRALKKES
ncbi:MAG: DUF177 domain-containing protein [Acidobacteria bacterium]|nr:DUF177 domain-containing protein [Acidobacteriota bacterium]